MVGRKSITTTCHYPVEYVSVMKIMMVVMILIIMIIIIMIIIIIIIIIITIVITIIIPDNGTHFHNVLKYVI